MAKINDVVNDYFKFREYKTPSVEEAFMFLVSEVGELGDVLVQQHQGWVRNHPEKKVGGEARIRDEVGDVMMMLTALCNQIGIDPIKCMLEKLESKGFKLK